MPDASWLAARKWGLCFHYLDGFASTTQATATTSQAWNRRVDAFDVPRFVENVRRCGAGYVLWTLGQNTGHYCAPNQTYDDIVGIAPSKCSRRDLVAEIASALAVHDIPLLAYLPSGAPEHEAQAVANLRWQKGEHRNGEFQIHWEAVIREWGERWKTLVSGWWIDGVYHADAMYRRDEAPNFASLAAALRAGDPDRILAFNSGWIEHTPDRKLAALTPYEDYTAGECDGMLPVCRGRIALAPDGSPKQWHVLTYAGEFWGRGEPRFPPAFIAGYTEHIDQQGGAITWDVPVENDGSIAEPFVEAFRALKQE